MDRIEYIADLDEEKPIKLSKAERDHILKKNEEDEAKEQALENPYENGISTVLEAFNELDKTELVGEITNQCDTVYVSNGWTGYTLDNNKCISKFLIGSPANLTIKLKDTRNQAGYGTISIIIYGGLMNYGLDLFKDPVDNKEKYYFHLKDKVERAGKTCYITDENPMPCEYDEPCVVDYWEDPEIEATDNPWDI